MNKKSFIEKDEYMTLDPNLKVPVNSSLRKIARAKATLEMIALVQKNSLKQPRLTLLQTELLFRYPQTPTKKQKKLFDVFIDYLLENDYHTVKSKQEIETYASLPKKKLKVKREQLSPFQNELLNIYDHEPTEEQMQKLEDFLFKLFNNLLNKFDDKKEAELVA